MTCSQGENQPGTGEGHIHCDTQELYDMQLGENQPGTGEGHIHCDTQELYDMQLGENQPGTEACHVSIVPVHCNVTQVPDG